MSFFGGLTSGGIGMPDAIFDQSSMLPPLNTAGYGGGFDGTPDARINEGSSLFSDMEPYAYGKGARISTQTAYLANPHNVQKIIPQLRLPNCIRSIEHSNFSMPHSVTDGDVAFIVRFATGKVRTDLLPDSGQFFKQGAGRAVDYICNISTINYIMRGLFTEKQYLNPAWKHFAAALGFEKDYDIIQNSYATLRSLRTANDKNYESYHKKLQDSLRCRAECLVRDHFRPFGVVIGSQKQGGQHEVGNKTVTYPVAYIVTVSIDGRNENLCNYWRHLEVSSGSDLGFFVQMKQRERFVLNYTKQPIHKHFTASHSGDDTPIQITFPQLCPGTTDTLEHEDKKIMGHWHFCMSQAMHHKATEKQNFNDITTLHVGALMLSTVSIVWVRNHRIKQEFVNNSVVLDDKDTIFKNVLAKHRFGPGLNAMPSVFSAYPNMNAQYLKASNNPMAQALQGRIAVSVSTVPPPRVPVVRPRPCTDAELAVLCGPPRAKQRISPPESFASPLIVTPELPSTAKAARPSSKKKNTPEGGSAI
jgi:hypothetical protein